MSPWNRAISQIEERHPPLQNLRIVSEEDPSNYALPNLLKTIIACSVRILEGEASGTGARRMVMVLPRLFNSTIWMAVGTTLCVMHDDLGSILLNPVGFATGDKLLVDNQYIVEYVGEEFNQYKLRLSSGPHGPIQFWPKSNWLRMQPTTTGRPLSKISGLPTQTPNYLIDKILGVTTSGRRDIFKNNIVLVTKVGPVVDFVDHLTATSCTTPEQLESIRDLFQWGRLGKDAHVDIISTGTIEAEPVLLLAPDILSCRDYLRSRNKQLENRRKPLVIFDGSSTFRNKLDVLDNILDTGCPVMICLERHEEEECTRGLSQRSFHTWRWTQQDLLALQETDAAMLHHNGSPNANVFTSFQRTISNYTRQQIIQQDCAGAAIDLAAEVLTELLNRFDPNEPDTKELEGQLFRCLLGSARLLYPAHTDETTAQELLSRLNETRGKIDQQKMWLGTDVIESALQIIAYLEDDLKGHELLTDSYSIGKAQILGDIFENSSFSSITVVVGSRDDVERTRNYWLPHIDTERMNVEFCYPPEVGKKKTPTEHLVVCGWLNARRMRFLIDGCFAPDMTVLLYPFEKAWFHQAIYRWRINNISMNSEQKANALGLTSIDFSDDLVVDARETVLTEPNSSEKQDSIDQFDITAFELRQRTHYLTALVTSENVGDEAADACLVNFSDDYYAFITPRHRLRVVTAWLTDRGGAHREIPERMISEIETGDYIVFPTGSSDDVIRELANLALLKAGTGNLREISDLWKDALNVFADSHNTLNAFVESHDDWPLDRAAERRAIKNLQRAGIKKKDQTIRNWLDPHSRTIGPQDDHDLDIIAQITKHAELNSRLQEVRKAIHDVRGAHHQASDYLVNRLLAALPEHLRNSSIDESLEIEIEGIGKAIVVRVEDISSELVQVASSQVNKLKLEE